MMRKHFVTLSVAVGSVVMLGLAWLGIAEADGPATYGNAATVMAASDRSDHGLIAPAPRRARVPARQSRAS